MFSGKKKSLAKLVSRKSKKDTSARAAQLNQDHLQNTTPKDTDNEEEEDPQLGLSALALKRLSWQGDLLLPLPLVLQRENSVSTPNLVVIGPPDMTQHQQAQSQQETLKHLPVPGSGNGTPQSESPPSSETRARETSPSPKSIQIPVAPPRGIGRTRSLRYAGSSVHNSNPPSPFDHNYYGGSSDGIYGSYESRQLEMRRRMLRQKLGTGSVESQDESSASTLSSPQEGTSKKAKGKSSLSSPRRTQSFRGAPIVRLQNADGTSRPLPVANLGSPQSSPVKIPAGPTGRKKQKSLSPSTSPKRSSPYRENVPTDPYAGYDNHGAAFGSPIEDPALLGLGPRKQSVSKSRSMTSLAGELGNNLGQTVKEARARPFLFGSVGPTSLLGPAELEKCFPDRLVRVFVGTWNMNGNTPPRHLADFLLPAHLDYVPDVLVVGTQECFPEHKEWEIRLQDTLGPSHVLFHTSTLGMLHQAIFLRRDLIWYCSIPETDSFNTRPGAQFKTKGAVATAFLLFGTSFLFVNSHLTAHQENAKDRIKDLKRLNAMLNLPKELPLRSAKHRDISEKFDCVFWSGDLNFRLEQSREVVIREVRDGLSVLDFDQLNYLREEGYIFRGYKEERITFPPTYKYDIGTTDKFDTSHKQRTPSYTDRILFKHSVATEVNARHYDSVQGVNSSDHKPVWGIWEVRVRPGRDSIPLAGGLFNREVYLHGLKRRAEALKPDLRGRNGAQSNMCTLQ